VLLGWLTSLDATATVIGAFAGSSGRAGLELRFDPPGVSVNPALYEANKRPPILQRWVKWRRKPKPKYSEADVQQALRAFGVSS
jgi:hypothetical protein